MVKVASERRGKGGVTGNETSEHVKYLIGTDLSCGTPSQLPWQLVLPRVAHFRSLGLIKQRPSKVLCDPLAAAIVMMSIKSHIQMKA